jgi:hypothetical protein
VASKERYWLVLIWMAAACRLRARSSARSSRSPTVVVLTVDLRRQTLGIHRALPLHPRQGRASRLGLDNPYSLLVDVDQVIRPAMTPSHDDLTDRDSLSCEEVEVPAVLHNPANFAELAVNQDPGTLFSGEALLVSHAFFPLTITASHYRGRTHSVD